MPADDPGSPLQLPPVDPTTVTMPADAVTPELLASLLADGDDELAAWALTSALAGAQRVDVYDGLLAGAMHLVGERWSTGQWSVAEEHLASQTLVRALDRIRPDLGPEGRVGPLAILAGVAGEHHMIGLVCLDHLLREHGWTVANLGADVPTPDLARFAARNDARLVALTASDPARTPATTEAIAAVRAAVSRPVAILLGGRLSSEAGIADAVGADWIGASLRGAIEAADAILGSDAAST